MIRPATLLWVALAGAVSFVDSWGDSRSGGRGHKGTDMMADYGTPTVAPVSGTVEHRGSSLGGLSWYLHGDDGELRLPVGLGNRHVRLDDDVHDGHCSGRRRSQRRG